MKGLIIKEKWADMILEGIKEWELRGSDTKVRGTIGIIKSGTGKIYGTVDVVGTKKIAKRSELLLNYHRHCVPASHEIRYENIWAWELTNPVEYDIPIPYKHPQGAVIWVNL